MAVRRFIRAVRTAGARRRASATIAGTRTTLRADRPAAASPTRGLRAAVSSRATLRVPSTHVIVAPGLLALSDAMLARSVALARLAALAAEPVTEPGGLDAATAIAIGFDGAATPLIALGAGCDPAGEWALQADPVHVEIGATEVLLTARVDDLDAGEAQALASDIDALTRADRLRIAVPRPDRWLALAADDVPGEASPVDAMIGHGLMGELRRDRSYSAWTRVRSEIEMLLHDHPVNRARSDRGAATVDDLWLWGGGRLPAAVNRFAAITVDACPGRAGDLARGVANASRSAEARECGATSITVVDTLHTESDFDTFDGMLSTALARLVAHRADELVLVADGAGNALTWRVRAPGVMRRLSLLVRRPQFTRR